MRIRGRYSVIPSPLTEIHKRANVLPIIFLGRTMNTQFLHFVFFASRTQRESFPRRTRNPASFFFTVFAVRVVCENYSYKWFFFTFECRRKH